jgi:cellulose synthase/poly-beta-1,6-N-acetylglucosamine synthase-like glycosyltransferase
MGGKKKKTGKPVIKTVVQPVSTILDASAASIININNISESVNVVSAPETIKLNITNKKQKLPFVSICTPTFNRRPFISSMIKCFEHQDYPKDRMEWIIVDDGTDKIGELVKDIPQVKYFSLDKKLFLGEKRNLMHEKTKGDIIVYMDDDDYYPPERVSHAVDMLQKTPLALCAGSSEIYVYFKHIDKMYQCGPYLATHSTAGTFAFRRELLKLTRYEDGAALAEEKHFLKNYTVPFVQLDPLKTILVFSHAHNTFDKRRLLQNQQNEFTKESTKTVDMFVKEPELRDFFMNRIEDLLKTYEPGRPNMKPDVLKQMVAIEKQRRQEMEMMQKQQQANWPTITLDQGDGIQQQLTIPQVATILQQQQNQINYLSNLVQGKDKEIEMIEKNQNQNQTLTPTITLDKGDGCPQQFTLHQVAAILQQQQSQILYLSELLQCKDQEIKELKDLLVE